MMPAAGAAEGAAAAAERSGSDCTDCSHCASRSSRRSRAGVRVSVNLGQFFTDQRARAFMWAPYGRCVQWLGRRVARVFGLPDDIALMCRGHMLPVLEPLLMLDRDDPVEVVNMSYVFTAHDASGEANAGQRTTNPTNPPSNTSASRAGAGMSSNVIIKQENTGQLPTSSQGDNLTDNLNIPGTGSGLDVETTSDIMEVERSSIDDGEDLQRLKRRALRLLDEHCHMLNEASAPKRLRRRRRRRPVGAAAARDASEADAPPEAGSSAGDAAPAVLRNGPGERPPRLVRALSPRPVVQYVL